MRKIVVSEFISLDGVVENPSWTVPYWNDEIAKFKFDELFGSGTLVQTLMQHDLVDSYTLLVYPVVLGKGKRLFSDGSSAALKLVESKTFSSGVTTLIYQPDRK